MFILYCYIFKSWRNIYCSIKKECLDVLVIRGFRLLYGLVYLYIYIFYYKKRSRNICFYSYVKIIIN